MTVPDAADNRRRVYRATFGGSLSYAPSMSSERFESVRTLLEAPSPAVLTTYRRDGSVLVSPVWFRWNDPDFEVVVARVDVKARHLARDPRCILVVFEAVRPFR